MKYKLNVFLFILVYLSGYCPVATAYFTCPQYQQHFQKILGYRPAAHIDPLSTLNVANRHSLTDQPVTIFAVNTDCWRRCMDDSDCSGYMLLFNSSTCYGFTKNNRITKYTFINGDDDLISDRNVVYFEKICLKDVPIMCKTKLWLFTKIPGNSLIFQGRKTLNTLVSKNNCSEQCLVEQEFQCLSATFIASHRNNYMRSLRYLNPTDEVIGTCILNDKDKTNQPDAFRVSSEDEEYIENQCLERGTEQDTCSYELYSNTRLMYADAEYSSLTEKGCKDKCASETQFFCQGVSYSDPKSGYQNTRCLLHSEDIISLGPRSLITEQNFVYMKRVKCLNVTVTCSNDEMIVSYTPYDSFLGRMYVSAHSEDCSSQGKGEMPSVLRLKIGDDDKEKRCGIVRAFQVNDGSNKNKTLVSTLLVLQTNPIVQTQSDRLVKVGCILDTNGNGTLDDIAIGSSLTFSRSDPPNQGSLLYNISEAYPKVTMQVIDLNQNKQITDVELGQDLELQILLDPPNSVYDIRAVQLIAKSETGHNSILLIDQRGCPTDLTIFPTLEKLVTSSTHMLYARFHAFKFAGSSFVNFEVKIQFCLNECSPINCGRNIWSMGRKKRSIPEEIGTATVYPVNLSTMIHLETQPPIPQIKQPSVRYKIIKSNRTLNTQHQQQIKLPNFLDDKTVYKFTNTKVGLDHNNAIQAVPESYITVQTNPVVPQRILSTVKAIPAANNNDTENAQVIETSRRNFTANNRILKQIEDVPLQIKLNVRVPDTTESDSLIYGENNQILVAAVDNSSEDLICINQFLIIILLLLWVVIQLVVISSCCLLIRKYKRLAKFDDDQSSLDKIHRALEIDNLNRRVRWADQGRSQVLMYT